MSYTISDGCRRPLSARVITVEVPNLSLVLNTSLQKNERRSIDPVSRTLHLQIDAAVVHRAITGTSELVAWQLRFSRDCLLNEPTTTTTTSKHLLLPVVVVVEIALLDLTIYSV